MPDLSMDLLPGQHELAKETSWKPVWIIPLRSTIISGLLMYSLPYQPPAAMGILTERETWQEDVLQVSGAISLRRRYLITTAARSSVWEPGVKLGCVTANFAVSSL